MRLTILTLDFQIFVDVHRSFNCPECEKPFDCKEGEERIPVFSKSQLVVRCRICSPRLPTAPQRGLMDYLNQPAFKKMERGYEYEGRSNKEPRCFGCKENMSMCWDVCDLRMTLFATECGHFLCQDCNYKRRRGEAFSCDLCNINYVDKSIVFHADTILPAFLQFIQGHAWGMDEMMETTSAKEEEDRRTGAVKNCSDCHREQPVEHLFNCTDCKTINCGSCSFVSHREHDVVRLLQAALVELEQKNDKRYTETLTGLHGNLKGIQKGIDAAVEQVLAAGKQRLAHITKRAKYDDAQRIVMTVEKAAEDFEKHCEEYIPVGRKLATKLTELSETLAPKKEMS